MANSVRKTGQMPCRWGKMCKPVVDMLTPRFMLALVAAGMAGMTLFSLVLQFGFHVIPCPMCWWQRSIHYVIFGVALAGVLWPRHHQKAVGGIVLLALVGLSIGIWQFSAQQGWLPFPASCHAVAGAVSSPEALLGAMQASVMVIPCDKDTFRLFGLSLAGWNVLAMLATAVWVVGSLCVAHRAERLAK